MSRPTSRPTLTTLALLAAGATAYAQPASTTLPANLPAAAAPGARPIADLERDALAKFDAGDFAGALPLLRDLSVRLRNSPERVGPLLEKVRVCESNLAAVQVVEGINAPRVPHARPAEGVTVELALEKLGNFAYDADKGGNIPDDVKALAGATVKLTGFMIPLDESDKVTRFVLVPSLFACCFGQPPQLQHTVTILCPPGKAVSYYPEEITVTGPLTVDEKRDEGYVTQIFEVRATSVRPASK